jgi:hypothetical protein
MEHGVELDTRCSSTDQPVACICVDLSICHFCVQYGACCWAWPALQQHYLASGLPLFGSAHLPFLQGCRGG